jgi:hypothetical protein
MRRGRQGQIEMRGKKSASGKGSEPLAGAAEGREA